MKIEGVRLLKVLGLRVLFSVAISSTSFARDPAASWKEFQSKVEKRTLQLSEQYSQKGIVFKFYSSDRSEGECVGEKKLSRKEAIEGKVSVSVKCDGQGWMSQQIPFQTIKKIDVGSLDRYRTSDTSKSLNIEKAVKFKGPGKIDASIDEAASFTMSLKPAGEAWEIVEIKYTSQDPG